MNTLAAMSALLFLQAAPATEPGLSFRANPPVVCHDARQPYLNFDFVLVNHGPTDVNLEELRGLVLDHSGNIIERRFIANAPWLNTIRAGADRLLYNPLFFSSVKPGSRIRYELDFDGEGRRTTSVEVRPQTCISNAPLMMPIGGRVLVYDGSDFLSHHRRSSYLGLEELGVIDNFQRFALDFMPVNAAGQTFTGDRRVNASWFGWNHPVRAAGDGVVVAVHNVQPDNDVVGEENRWTQRSLERDPMTTYGNYVLIDHGKGEFSLAAHLRQGSVVVRRGQTVRAGELIGRIGNSGSSLGPHLHFELRNGWGVSGIRTMPPYFGGVTVLGTGETAGEQRIPVNTGDILVSR